jgi:NADPH:quinone reductase-like Zn-dependent oxidoreductase
MPLTSPGGFTLMLMFSFAAVSATAAPRTMQAAQIGEEGGLTVRTVQVPAPKAGEVLIRVRAAGVNPVDWKIASRRAGQVAGTDVSGTIDSVGAGVTEWRPGDPVLGFARQSGSYAEYAVVPVESLARKPKALTFEQAAGIPIAAETAYRALHETAGIASGQTVLIHGAAGGVGSAAVQIARAAGARVIGTASPGNHEFLRSLGVEQVIDYRTQKFEDLVKDVDIVLNTANAATNVPSISVVRRGGVLVSIVGAPDAAACAAAGIRCGSPDRGAGASNAALLAKVGELAEAGKFTVHVEEVFPLSRAQEAWEKSRTGHTRGKLIILVSEGPTMRHQ